MMSMKPRREVATPHKDVLSGTFQQAVFAADISRVHEGTGPAQLPTLQVALAYGGCDALKRQSVTVAG